MGSSSDSKTHRPFVWKFGEAFSYRFFAFIRVLYIIQVLCNILHLQLIYLQIAFPY